ncbi:MAG TPA: alkaline phosphatase family protein [Mucilaginibacter sp.]
MTKVLTQNLYSNVKISLFPVILCLLFFGCKPKNDQINFDIGIKKVGHIVVIYMENHSFDNLYGEFEGANGLSNVADSDITQLDTNNVVYNYLPTKPGSSVLPTNLKNHFFNIDQYIRPDMESPNLTHLYYQEQLQINHGYMNKFAAYNNVSFALTMGYYTTTALPLYPIAKQYTLCDNFFHSAFGGSYLNHQWLIAAATPFHNNGCDTVIAKIKNGKLIKDGSLTPDGYVVNTSYSVNSPRPPKKYYGNDSTQLIPYQTNPTIGDRLTADSVSWVWYSGGWNDALGGKADPSFQYHHQPFIYYKNYADGTQAKKDHLRDETEFFAAAKNGKLPYVSFVKPLGTYNEHPGYSTVKAGEDHAIELINAVLNGPNGKDAVIILTYDENGGSWDHVKPPVIDSMGPGSRVPTIIIGPFAKKGFVDHTQYETVSILAFIEKRFGLKPLNSRDKNAKPLTNAFNF